MISAKEAEAIGLVNAVFPVEGFKESVDKFLGDFMNKSRLSSCGPRKQSRPA